MPVVHPDPPAGAADDSGTLVLASLEAVSHAYEAEGSRLSPSLLLSLSREVRRGVGVAGLVQGSGPIVGVIGIELGSSGCAREAENGQLLVVSTHARHLALTTAHPAATPMRRWRRFPVPGSSALQPTMMPAWLRG